MLEEFPHTLKRLNLKITPKRVAILEILIKESVYLSPEDIWKKMKKRFIKIGLPTIYRNLEELSERNIISKVTHPDRQLYYFLPRRARSGRERRPPSQPNRKTRVPTATTEETT